MHDALTRREVLGLGASRDAVGVQPRVPEPRADEVAYVVGAGAEAFGETERARLHDLGGRRPGTAQPADVVVDAVGVRAHDSDERVGTDADPRAGR